MTTRAAKTAARTAVIVAVAARAALAVTAFPGAEGFGANATGGRGGEVYHVTSLADTNTLGTLRYGLTHALPAGVTARTIVFDTSGMITLNTNLSSSVQNLTIAGQSAPAPGITIRGWQTAIESNNAIVRYLRFRPGDMNGTRNFTPSTSGFQGDSAHARFAKNVVFDHVSASWSVDEVLSASSIDNVSIQNCIISEALRDAGHYNDDNTGTELHSYGMLLGSTDANYLGRISVHHNLFISNDSRNPRAGNDNQLDFVNNVAYNWGGRLGYSGGAAEGTPKINYVNNYLIAGPSTSSTHANEAFYGGSTNTQIYQSGNLIDGNKNGTLGGTNTGTTMFTIAGGTATFMGSPFGFPSVTTDTALAAYNKAAAGAGASIARDSVDLRLINELSTNPGTLGAIINSQNQVGGYPTVATIARPADWDNDADGMPSYWEMARGSNPAAADNNVVATSGYTQLEEYLNYLPNTVYWNADTNATWGMSGNWLGSVPNAVDAWPVFGAVITAPRTVTNGSPRTVGMINFDSSFAYTIGGATGTITLDDSSGRAAVSVLSGSHTISAPLSLADDVTLVVRHATDALTLTGTITTNGHSITKAGTGALAMRAVTAPSMNVNAGTVSILSAGGGGSPSSLGVLSIAPSSTLDLDDTDLITGTGKSIIESLIASARNSGPWNSTGITSTAARLEPNHATGLGVMSGAEYDDVTATPGTFSGQTYAPSDSLVKYAWNGDTNFDGTVNFDDYVRVDVGFNTSLTGWTNGDFNYSGWVDFDDYVLIDIAFNVQAGTFGRAIDYLTGNDRSKKGSTAPEMQTVVDHLEDFGPKYAAAFLSAVPEPSALVTLTAVLASALIRRRYRATAPTSLASTASSGTSAATDTI